MFQTAVKKISRMLVRKSVFFLPEERQIAIERRHRGREQLGKLKKADCAIVSHGKSGRTWLRVMLSRIYQQRHGLPEGSLLSFDDFHRKNAAVPKIFFTHDNYLRNYTCSDSAVADYGGRRVLMLVRHPADVTVSQYFQWKHRMRVDKKGLLGYPDHGEDIELFDFMMRPEWGVARVIEFMNFWARDFERLDPFTMTRYEDLRRDPENELARVMAFIGTPATAEEIREAVEYGSVENMRQREQQSGASIGGGRLRPRDVNNPDSYKVRRAKVGGYRDYFDDEQVRQIDELVDSRLAPVFGYHSEARRETTQNGPAEGPAAAVGSE
jgi:hypothetical protein